MANSDKNIVITPNVGSSSADPSIVFTGANTTTSSDITLSVLPKDGGTLLYYTATQNLLELSAPTQGGIAFEVDASDGIPLIVADSSRQVTLVPYGGAVGIATATPEVSLDVSGATDAIALPVGTNDERPSNPTNGLMRYNETLGCIEAYVQGSWVEIVSDYQMSGSTTMNT